MKRSFLGKNKIKLLVFDYDGVIARSHEILLRAIGFTSKKLGVEAPSVEQLQNTEAHALFKLMGLGPLGTLRFVSCCRTFLSKQELPPLVEGVQKVFQIARQRNFILGIVSSNRTEMIERFLHREEIRSCFDFIEGGLSLWAKEKTLWKLSARFQPLKALYVGDEERDIVSGQAAGFQVIAVSWGVKSPKLLKSFQPNYFVETPEHLAELLGSL